MGSSSTKHGISSNEFVSISFVSIKKMFGHSDIACCWIPPARRKILRRVCKSMTAIVDASHDSLSLSEYGAHVGSIQFFQRICRSKATICCMTPWEMNHNWLDAFSEVIRKCNSIRLLKICVKSSSIQALANKTRELHLTVGIQNFDITLIEDYGASPKVIGDALCCITELVGKKINLTMGTFEIPRIMQITANIGDSFNYLGLNLKDFDISESTTIIEGNGNEMQAEAVQVSDVEVGTGLASALAQLTSLQTLEIFCLGPVPVFTSDELSATMSALVRLTGLQDLTFIGIHHCMAALAAGLLRTTVAEGLPALTRLDLSACSIGVFGTAALAALGRLTGLTSLRLADNVMNDEEAVALSSALTALVALQTLDLKGSILRGAGTLVVTNSLALLPRLRSVDLEYNNISCGGGLKALGLLSCLESLSLGCNRLFMISGSKWAGLGQLVGLQRLDLRGNEVGFKIAPALAAALTSLTGLQALELGWNSLMAKGACKVLEALAKLPHLRSLGFESNGAGRGPFSSVAAALAQLKSLETLNFGDNALGLHEARLLAAALPAMPSLAMLDVSFRNRLGEQGKALLLRAAERLRIRIV